MNTGPMTLATLTVSCCAVVSRSIRLVTTPCHLGGVRWWFVCPLAAGGRACGRRVRKLYLCGRYFGCRTCHRLTYRTSQESDSRVYALLRGGLDGMGDPRRMSVPQLGIALKALTLRQKRIDRYSGGDARTGRRGGGARRTQQATIPHPEAAP